ncbi:MAG: bifunctional histidinol-phosphatase/imidazoleglycerol-phosphate dehydratase HisB [Proteobacteria bacterium]|nr:bifunctional histidinol-phosphatase/imidazoleglycerol-phosphate dehydratase HisB [Pseudomonadota bacterium]
MSTKILFLDRDGTLIHEPPDHQIDRLEKIKLLNGVIPALLSLRDAGYRFVMVSNQDGLGTKRYPKKAFEEVQTFLLNVLGSQGIRFEAVRVCPHLPKDDCVCRKPRLGLVRDYLADPGWDRGSSFVIGDRETDIELAKNMGIGGARLGSWSAIAKRLLGRRRTASVKRETKETSVLVDVDLDGTGDASARTGIGFFDHMLEQVAKHGGFDMTLEVKGDVHVDDHHTVEDAGLALGAALRKALGDKVGIQRYGFLLPMDEASAKVSLDLSGRPYFKFKGLPARERVGGLAVEMVPHFFRSLAESLGASLHIELSGENAHHVIESAFKGVGRSLRMAIAKGGQCGLPSTKGTL